MPDDKVLVRRFIDEVWNQGNVALADEMYDPDLVVHFLHDSPGLSIEQNAAGMKRTIARLRAGFPDYHVKIGELIAEGDRLAYWWTATGTHLGQFMGISPTGRPVTFRGMTFVRFVEGKFVEGWQVWDWLGQLHQLGILPVDAALLSSSSVHPGRPATRPAHERLSSWLREGGAE